MKGNLEIYLTVKLRPLTKNIFRDKGVRDKGVKNNYLLF